MKKQLSILLVLSVFMSLFAFPALAAEEPVAVSAQVRYTDLSDNPVSELPAGGKLTVGCEMVRIDPSDRRTQNYVFFTIVTKNGSVFSAKKTAGQVADGERNSVTVDIPEDTTGVVVESYLWDNLLSARPLAEKATFGSAENNLLELYLDGEPMTEFDGSAQITKSLPASYSHTPQLRAVAADSSAKIEVDEITTLPQQVGITVTSHTGEVNTYQLSLELAAGTVTNPIATDAGGGTQKLTMAKMMQPVYSDTQPGDEGFSYATAIPSEYTYFYSDRPHSSSAPGVYYADMPDELVGATAVQTSLQLMRYADNWKAASSATTEMQWFTIDRSAEVYLICFVQPSWLSKEGFVSNGKTASIAFNSEKLSTPSIYKKTYTVPEGETLTIGLKGMGALGNGYSIAVKFLEPTAIAALSNAYVDDAIDFVFDPTQEEQTVNLLPGITEVPDISYVTAGVGASVSEIKATELPGVTEATVTSADGKSKTTYRFNINVCENKLSAITVDGKALEDFDPDVNAYTYKLPFGKPELLEVSAQAANNLVTVDVQQATAATEEGAAIIICTFYDGSVNTYRVIFEETLIRPTVFTKKPFSWTGVLSKAYSGNTSDTTTEYMFDFNSTSDEKSANSTMRVFAFEEPMYDGGSYKQYRGVALLQLDLSKLTGIDLTQPVKMLLYQATQATADIQLYDAGDFVWSDENLTLTTIRDNYAQFVQAEKLVASGLEKVTLDGTEYMQIDITDFVLSCFENGNLTPTVAVYGATPEGSSAPARRNSFYFNFKYSAHSMITYYAYEE